MRHFLAFVIFLFPLVACAQDISVSGIVRDKKGQPLESMTVTLFDGKEDVVAYGITDRNGCFVLTLGSQDDQSGLSVVVTSIGYKKTAIPLKDKRNPVIIDVEEESFTVPEITVKSAGIWESGDTLSYSIGKFKQTQDRSVADVLKRMPGISVADNGKIQYQGKDVSTVYVEGLDLTGGSYTQVTNNLDADKIGSVQILENHQKMKVLKDLDFSDQAALNLKLKDNAKEVSQWLIDIGVGRPAQKEDNDVSGNARLLQMRFGKSFQQFNIYRNDYTGEDITPDMGNMPEDDNGIEKSLLSSVFTPVPGISGRYENNAAHLLSSNSLWKKSEDDVLSLSASAYTDITKVSQSTCTEYRIGSEPLAVVEDNYSRKRHSEIRAALQYTSNGKNQLLDNILSLYGDFDHERALTSVNNKASRQDVRPQQFFIKDKFKTMKVVETGKWGLDGYLAFNHLPGRLLVMDGSSQKSRQDAFAGNLTLTSVKPCGQINSVWKFGAGGQMSLLSLARDSSSYTTYSYVSLRGFAAYGVTYSGKKVRTSFNIPVSLQSRSYGDSISALGLFIYPTFYLDWSIGPSWRMTASAQYTYTPNSTESMWQSVIYRDYMNATEGDASLSYEEGIRSGVAIQYRNILEGLFCNLRVSYVSRRHLPLYDRMMYHDGTLLSRIADRTGKDNSLTVGGGISKVFRCFTVAINGNASVGESAVMLNGVDALCKTKGASGNLSLSWSPVRWLSFESKPFCSVQVKNIDGLRYRSFFYGSNNKVYIPVSDFIFQAAIDHFKGTHPERSEATFADVSVSYKKKTIEYETGVRNIFGARSFSRTELSDYYEKTIVTELRPREMFCEIIVSL